MTRRTTVVLNPALFVWGLVLMLFIDPVFSQLDTRHWLPPIYATQENSLQEQYIYLSTPNEAPFQVRILDAACQNLIAEIEISNAAPGRFDIGGGETRMGTADITKVKQVLSGMGYCLQADQPFFANFRVKNGAQAGSITAKGQQAAGSIFRVGKMLEYEGVYTRGGRSSYVSIIALENDTEIQVSDYDNNTLFADGTEEDIITVTLNQGESYIVGIDLNNPATTVESRNALLGALVQSKDNKKIVISCGSTLGGTTNNGKQDFGIDQPVPIDWVGTEYIFVKGSGGPIQERPIIVAHENNTAVFVNGAPNPTVILQAGEYFAANEADYGGARGNMFISTSKPSFAYQMLASTTSDANLSLNFVPPISCYQPREVNNISSVNRIGNTLFDGGVLITTRAGSNLRIRDDNGPVLLPAANQVPGNPVFETYRINGLIGNVSVVSDGALQVGLFGRNQNIGWAGYYAGFPSERPFMNLSADPGDCGEGFNLTVVGSNYDVYNWFKDGIFLLSNNTGVINTAPYGPGEYSVEGILLNCGATSRSEITEITCSPGCLSALPSIWLKSEGITSIGNIEVENWLDQSGNATLFQNPFRAEQDADRPTLGKLLNFNPVINFDGAKKLNTNTINSSNIRRRNRFSIYAVLNSRNNGTIFSQGGSDEARTALTTDQIYLADGQNPITLNEPIGQTARLISAVRSGTQGNAYLNGNPNGNGNFVLNKFNDGSISIGAWIDENQNVSEYWDGDLAELFIFPRAHNQGNREKIESFLAVKFALTLSHTYRASDSSVIFDPTIGYSSNIAGIGFDDCSTLNQKQSKSIEEGAIVTIGLDSIGIANALHGSSFASDMSYMIWGHDGGSLKLNSTFAGADSLACARMNRSWLVSEKINPVGQVMLSIPDTLNAQYLIVSKDGSFANQEAIVKLLPDGKGNLQASYNFTDESYFTFGNIPTPGAVSEDLGIWIHSEKEVTNIGGEVVRWDNLASQGITFEPTDANTPDFIEANGPGLFNFHDYLDFDIRDNLTSFNSPFEHESDSGFVIAVIKPDFQSPSGSVGGKIIGFEKGPNNGDLDEPHLGIYPDMWIWNSHSNPISVRGEVNLRNDSSYMLTYAWQNLSWETHINGKKDTTFTLLSNGGSGTEQVILGDYLNNFLDANLAELIVFRRYPTLAEQRKLYSYLAIKYGMTIPQSYYAADWDGNSGGIVRSQGNGYDLQIAGIGRDDCGALDQRQSKSITQGALVTIGLDSITTRHALHISEFNSDQSYLLWGNNGLGTDLTEEHGGNDSIGCKRIARVWLISEALNPVRDVAIRIPDTLNVGFLAVSTDPTFATNIRYRKLTSTGTGELETRYNFADGDYFTFVALISEVDAGQDQTICLGDSAMLQPDNGSLYNWAPANSLNYSDIRNPLAFPTLSTTYTLTLTDSLGCTNQDTVRVIVNPLPPVDAGEDQTIAKGQSTIIQATGGDTYSWSPIAGLSSTDSSLTIAKPDVSTTYTVLATDSNGCMNGDTIRVTVETRSEICNNGIDDDNDGLIDCADDDCVDCDSTCGPVQQFLPQYFNTAYDVYENDLISELEVDHRWQISKTLNGPTAPVVRIGQCAGEWIDPTIQNSGWIAPFEAADCDWPELTTLYFHLEINLPANQVATFIADLTVYADNVVQETYLNGQPLGISGASYCNGCQLDVYIDNGWQEGKNTLSFLLENTAGGGPFGLSVASKNSDSDGDGISDFDDRCPNTQIGIPVDGKGCPILSVDAGNDSSICFGQSLQLNAQGQGGIPSWSPSAFLSDTSIFTPTLQPDSTVQYKLTVTDEFGCFVEDSVEVIINPLPEITTSPDTAICIGDFASISAQSTGSYLWSPVRGLSDNTVASPLANPQTTTTYTVLVTDQNNCVDSARVSVAVNPLPKANAGIDQEICLGDSASLEASGGIEYQWLIIDGLSETDISNPLASPFSSTEYIVNVSDANACADTDTVSIIVHQLPIVDAGQDQTICYSDTANLMADASTAVNFNWTPVASLGNPNLAFSSAFPQEDQTYKIQVTDSLGCSNQDSVQISVLPLPEITSSPDTSICLGESIQIFAQSTGNYLWVPDSSLSDNTINNPVATPSSNTTYTVIVTDQHNCIDSAQVSIVVKPLPNADAGPDLAICSGESIDIQASGGANYLWTPAMGLSDSSQSAPVASPLVTTTYVVNVTDNKLCSATDTMTLTVNPLPIVDAGPDLSVCFQDTARLQAISPDAAIINWTPGLDLNRNDILSPILTALNSRTYRLEVTDTNGCVNTDSLNINILPLPIALASGIDEICEGEEAILEVEGGASYLWNTGDIDSNIIVAPSSSQAYWVRAISKDGCIGDTVYKFVEVYPLPEAIFTVNGSTQPVEAYDLIEIDFGNQSLNSVEYFWDFGDGGTSTSLTPNYAYTRPGTYSVSMIAYNELGCADTANYEQIRINPARLFVPTAITPNGDGHNDVFTFFTGGYELLELQIFNRWGKLIYEEKGLSLSWDGKYEGQRVAEGVYVVKIFGQTLSGRQRIYGGTLTIIF